MNDIETIRVCFEKAGRARYISHLDLNRTMTRVLRRAGIPLWYTEGFNRHPYITFAAPLSLGYEGKREYMDFRLEETMSMAEIVSRLNACMPEGITVLSAAPAQRKVGEIALSRWEMRFDGDAQAVKDLLARDSIMVEKRTKKGGVKEWDIKPDLQEVLLQETAAGCTLTLTLPASSERSINPSLLLTALDAHTGETISCAVTRLGLYTADGTLFA